MKTLKAVAIALLVSVSSFLGPVSAGDGVGGCQRDCNQSSSGTQPTRGSTSSQQTVYYTDSEGKTRQIPTLAVGQAATINTSYRSTPAALRRGNAAGYSYIVDQNGDGVLDPPASTQCTGSSCGSGAYEGVPDCSACSESSCSARGTVVNGSCACDRSGSGIRYMCAP